MDRQQKRKQITFPFQLISFLSSCDDVEILGRVVHTDILVWIKTAAVFFEVISDSSSGFTAADIATKNITIVHPFDSI